MRNLSCNFCGGCFSETVNETIQGFFQVDLNCEKKQLVLLHLSFVEIMFNVTEDFLACLHPVQFLGENAAIMEI